MDSNYVLSWLERSSSASGSNSPEAVRVEFRLACVSDVYSNNVQTSDWTKSDETRILLEDPFFLFVSTRRLIDFPQEIVIRINLNYEKISGSNRTHIFLPDRELVKDIASFLTLYLRRLVVPGPKVREVGNNLVVPDWPTPIITEPTAINWKQHPATIISSSSGQEIIDHNPQPVGVNPDKLRAFFLNLPRLDFAKELLRSARLYRLALDLMNSYGEISYQLLISSIETITSANRTSYQPPDDEKIRDKKSVYDLAIKNEMSEDLARQLALEANKGRSWNKRAFVGFLRENSDDRIWQEDDEFGNQQIFLPNKGIFERTLSEIYNVRSGTTHGGKSFPSIASFAGGPTISSSMVRDIDLSGTTPTIPPVIWFERLVQIALMNYVEREIAKLRPIE